MSDQLRLPVPGRRFLAGALPWVPDSALSPYKLPHHDPGIRRALPAIEELCDDHVAWALYADLEPGRILETARTIQRERRRHRRK